MLENFNKIHFVGIRGVGMSALAIVAKQMGKEITGSDVAKKFITENNLSRNKIIVNDGFSDSNINENIDLVVYSASHDGPENIEVQTARKKNIKSVSYAKALAIFFESKKIIAVAGSHGKTTTTSMLAKILVDAKMDPSWIIGTGNVPDLQSNGNFGKGDFAVIEADEYVDEIGGKSKFLYLNPFGLIITSIDWDHPDVFSEKQFFINFKKLLKRTSKNGIAILADIPKLRIFAKGYIGKTRFIASNFNWSGLKLNLIGDFNLQNATFAAAMAHELGVNNQIIISSLANYKGVQRRLEYKKEIMGIKVYDDYAHHPTEIEKTIKAVRNYFSDYKINVLFQPHTYSRTKTYLENFGKSLSLADRIYLAPIFASAREKEPEQKPLLFEEISKYNTNVLEVDTSNDFWSAFKETPKTDKELLLVMGAGDIYQWIENDSA